MPHLEAGDFLASALGRLVSDVRYGALPPRAVEIAKTGIADCLAVALAGRHEEPVKVLRRALGPGATGGESTLFGVMENSARYPGPDAAWINGTAGHVLDYDDVALGHPSVVIVPAILADGESLGSSGAELIAAYVAGYEAWTELVRRERGAYQLKGWHPTSTLGALAATAACANLRKLDSEQSAHAFGIAAAQAAGIVANYGTMTKAVQVGKAAHTGVLSARLAQQGLRSTVEALDHDRGYLKAISPAGDVDVQRRPRGDGDWHICRYGLNIKRYPVCYFAHRSIDAMLELAREHRLQPRQVDRIEVALSSMHATVLKNHQPQDGLEAKFSAEFAVAVAVLDGNVGLRQLRDDFVRRPDVQALMRQVTVTTNEDYDPETPGFSRWDEVTVQTIEGARLSRKVRYAKGNAQAPLSAGDLKQKFLDCVAIGDAGLDGARLFETLQGLERLENCRDLFATALAAAEA